MHLASLRARHMDANYTQSRMLTYTRWYLVFESLYDKPAPASRQFRPGLSALLNIPRLRHPLPRNFTTVAFQSTFLHHQVPLAGVEFLDLLCAHFELPTTRRSYTHLERLHFQIGLKCTREEDRETFLGTDARHDMLRLRGHGQDGNSFCCETICFVQVDNVKTLPRQRPDAPDRRVLVLVRWFSPHADSWERDSLRRPLCPGPLSINNCLSQTPTPRSVLCNQGGGHAPSQGFREHARTAFGINNDDVLLDLWNREKHAYYGFITPDNIASRVNMAPTFQSGSAVPDYSCWLETVTMY